MSDNQHSPTFGTLDHDSIENMRQLENVSDDPDIFWKSVQSILLGRLKKDQVAGCSTITRMDYQNYIIKTGNPALYAWLTNPTKKLEPIIVDEDWLLH